MQGIGPALSVPNGFSILEASFPPGQRKDTALSLYSSGAPLGFVIGSVMSSVFAVNFAWEWCFFVLAAVCFSAAGLSVLFLPQQDPRKGCCIDDIWVKLDFTGIILSALGLALFSFAWNQAPAFGWRTPHIYILLIIGVLLLAAFVYNETVVASPLVPLRVMNSSTNLVLACVAAGWGCFVVWAFYLFQIMEAVRDWDCLVASAAVVPMAVESLAVAFLLAYLTPGIEVYWAFLVSFIGFTSASILVATAPLDQTYWANIFVSTLLLPLGIVMAGPLATILLRNSLPEDYRRVIGGLVLFVLAYSMSIALGMARTVETQVNEIKLDVLSGYRGAQYYGIGLGGLGTLLASALLFQYSSNRSI